MPAALAGRSVQFRGEARPAPNGEFLVTAALPLGSDPEGAP